MRLTKSTYVPSIRWRQGEYQALFRLHDSVKRRIVPLVTIPDIEYDFEEKKPKHSVQEHVHPFVRRFSLKWGVRPAWIGIHEDLVQSPMENGTHIFTYIFNELRSFVGGIVPAIPLSVDSDTVRIVRTIVRHDKRGIGILMRLEDLMKVDLNSRLQGLMSELKVDKSVVDLLVDLQSPNLSMISPSFSM